MSEAPGYPPPAPPARARWLTRGFAGLLATQFCGAANDNILKQILTYMVIDGCWAGRLGAGGQGIVGLCFTLPFIALSGYGGQVADRFSKRDVSVFLRTLEIPIALAGMIGFWTENLWLTLLSLVLLTSQSAFFGPAKYGIIPELVAEGELSRANGLMNMLTNIAVIAGSYAAGVLADLYYPLGADGMAREGVHWAPGLALVGVALAGLATALMIGRVPSANPGLRFSWNPFGPYLAALRGMARTPLLMVVMAWGYFYLLAGLALLSIPEYTLILGISREQASRLLAVMAITIGAGSFVAGWVSGHRIEPRLAPIGAAGMSVFFILLGLVPPTFGNVALFILGAGFFAGFYIIPLQALMQKLSPGDERGRFLGTANAISFAFLSVAALLYWLIRPLFDSSSGPGPAGPPQRVFLISAGLMIVGALYFVIRLRKLIYGRRAPEAAEG